jgi:hypothetical protein
VLVYVPVTVVVELNVKLGQVVTFVLVKNEPELQGLNDVVGVNIGVGVVIGTPLILIVTTLLYTATVVDGAVVNTLSCFMV